MLKTCLYIIASIKHQSLKRTCIFFSFKINNFLNIDSIFQELESLFSEHFGRTPVNTPAASQDFGACGTTSDDDDDVHADGIVDIDERARQYVQSVVGVDSDSSGESDIEQEHTRVEANLLQSDDPDLAKIRNYHANGCGCKSHCVSQFSEQAMYTHILDMREMTKNEKEMYIMGSLTENDRDVTKRGKKRQRSRHSLTFSGRPVCKKTYLLLYDIGKHTLQTIKSHMHSQGVTPRQHGNVGKKPAHALNFEDTKRVVQFISNYGDEHGLPQPAAPRGRDDVPPVYLSSEMTKKRLHDLYVNSCTTDGHASRYVKYSTFCNIWNHCLPHVKIAKPKDDVCATCEKLRKKIIDSVTEEEKLETTR